MNVLMFETPPVAVARLVRSILRVDGFRVSISHDVEESIRKLDTSLFDALCLGPAGAPKPLLDHVQEKFPHLPVVLAGTTSDLKPQGQITAVLPAPLSSRTLTVAFRSIRRRRNERIEGLPVEVLSDNVSIVCRLAGLTPETMVLAGESDEFHRYFGGAGMKVRARVWGTDVGGKVARTEIDPARRMRRVDVNLEGSGARDVLVKLVKE